MCGALSSRRRALSYTVRRRAANAARGRQIHRHPDGFILGLGTVCYRLVSEEAGAKGDTSLGPISEEKAPSGRRLSVYSRRLPSHRSQVRGPSALGSPWDNARSQSRSLRLRSPHRRPKRAATPSFFVRARARCKVSSSLRELISRAPLGRSTEHRTRGTRDTSLEIGGP